uniref:Uncharacterized protein n=1 Tax=Kalanchoe fedtschenkoi TaxID=63787 RepID=A0A7N1A831_KALFE
MRNMQLPSELNKVMHMRNLLFNILSEEMYNIFDKYKAIRRIQIGMNKDMRGISFMVYVDMYEAKKTTISPAQMSKKFNQEKKEEHTNMQEKYGVSIKL